MNFLIDAQLPIRLARQLADAGHDVIHSSQLPDRNRTTDPILIAIADAGNRVMVTKDRDFEIGHLLHGAPQKLLLITTGNIRNNDLLDLVAANLTLVTAALDQNAYVELSSTAVVVHGAAGNR